MTVEEYLAFEEQSEVRHEYVAGEIHAFAGGTFRHGQISANIVSYLRQAAIPLGCFAFGSDVLLKAAANIMYYPDATVTCDPEDDGRQRYLVRPCFVAEVLSPSTATIDLREKLFVYHNISSLQTIIYVYQDRREILHYFRQDDRSWTRQAVTEGSVDVPCLNIKLSVDQIYEAVRFQPLDANSAL